MQKSFKDLCLRYEKLTKKIKNLDKEIGEIDFYLSLFRKKRDSLLQPRVDVVVTKRLSSRYFLIRKVKVIDLKKRVLAFYRWEGWKYYSTPSDDDRDFAPVGIGVPEGGGDILGLGVLEREEPLDPFFIGLVKSLQRKIKRLEKVLESLRKKKSLLRKEVEIIVREVGRRVFGNSDLDEVEYEVSKDYIKEALDRQIFDLQVLTQSKSDDSKNSKERLLDLIFGRARDQQESEESEQIKVYVEDFDMTYVIIPSERGGWIIRDKDFMLIDKSFVPQIGMHFYRGRVKKVIVDKRGREVPIIEIIGKF